jgi:hypothetical protein
MEQAWKEVILENIQHSPDIYWRREGEGSNHGR